MKLKFKESKISEITGKGKIQYEDDLVEVFENGKSIYKGLEDYDPLKYENWIYNDKYNRYEMYIMNNLYIKVLR